MTFIACLVAGVAALATYQGLVQEPVEMRSKRPLSGRVADLLGVPAKSVLGTVAAGLGCALAAVVVVAGLSGALVPALAFAAAAAAAPVALVRARALRGRRRLRDAWPDALATLIAGVRAGVSLSESCAALATRGPEETRPAFASFAATLRATGSFPAALDRLRAELSDPVGDRVVAALAMAHEVGGTDLVRVLRTLADFVREDLRVRKEIEARWSWTVTAARVAAAAPWLVLLLMAARPEAARAYDSPAGVAVIGAGAAATVLGYRLMLRAARLPEERRLSS